ncbi:acetolactate synthase [Mollisia scopiformis]|uniref:Acetolactate synthase n=1 Tax=Mollisia scopiformis TaxID=149040 RepID=A0A132B7E1_MOLSC|nr:acetolactate synthase [Mollisia scopiformis]KUJ08326.1 acetolactate synthase [Mollisia scopiformis]
MPSEYTASDAFFEALWDSGVRACFVNLGSDHPSLIEAILKGQQSRKDTFPQIYTCPNEMVAVSMADGWARATGSPQAVIVHVDVGTQAIAAAMHNANTGRAPVFIFAGLCPYTEGGCDGSRTEYQHWLQDAPDQKAIIADYCRYTGDIRTGSTVKQMVFRAMQLASSDPKGPVYLTGAREVMAEKLNKVSTIDEKKHGPIGPAALPQGAVETIAQALVSATKPLVITGYSGRNHACPEQLVRLAESIPGLRVLDTGGCDMCFPAGHPSYVGFCLSFDQVTTEADMIFVLDCDVPWIPSRNPPREACKIYQVDIDPLNATIGFSFFPANGRWKADSYTALNQLNQYLAEAPDLQETLRNPIYRDRWEILQRKHAMKVDNLSKIAIPSPDGYLDIHQTGAIIKSTVPGDTVYVVEAATCAMPLSDQLQVQKPGSWINCGGAGLGWSGGAALGVKLSYDISGSPKFVCQVVGDGTYLFSVPSSVYWIASRYGIPVLTVVLNNRGWNAPRRSYELVHPHGLGATATNKQMHISFDPPPDYGGIAKAAAGSSFGGLDSGVFAARASTASELKEVLHQAVQAVQDGRGALVEAVLSVDEMGETMVQR